MLLIPASIQITHALENHEHTVCTSLVEKHLHKNNLDCEEFHKQVNVFSMDLPSNFDVIPTHFYSFIIIDKPQIINEVYYLTKSSRGPPNFTV